MGNQPPIRQPRIGEAEEPGVLTRANSYLLHGLGSADFWVSLGIHPVVAWGGFDDQGGVLIHYVCSAVFDMVEVDDAQVALVLVSDLAYFVLLQLVVDHKPRDVF